MLVLDCEIIKADTAISRTICCLEIVRTLSIKAYLSRLHDSSSVEVLDCLFVHLALHIPHTEPTKVRKAKRPISFPDNTEEAMATNSS
jgi:hypothetical protein